MRPAEFGVRASRVGRQILGCGVTTTRQVYLDWNSTTPLAEEVVEGMAQQRDALWGNPSSVHSAGRRARHALEQTRETLAEILGFHPRDVVMTGSGTEANNLALHAAEVLMVSRLEHPSVTRMAEKLERSGKRVVWLDTPALGRIERQAVERALGDLEPALRRRTVVALMAANHETGVVQPIEEVARAVHAVGARLHVDAVQLLGKASHASLDAADSVTVTAHKVRGPKGIGALLFRGPAPQPLLVGGSQERGLRAGTQDAWLALGFRLALERMKPARIAALAPLRDDLEQRLAALASPNVGGVERLPHVTSLMFPQIPGPELVAALDLDGICVASGSACSAGTDEPSPVIAAMAGPERAKHTLRVSLGEDTTPAHVDRLVDALFRILAG